MTEGEVATAEQSPREGAAAMEAVDIEKAAKESLDAHLGLTPTKKSESTTQVDADAVHDTAPADITPGDAAPSLPAVPGLGSAATEPPE